MAGHSKYANTKHRKSRQDEKRSKFFTKLHREIIAGASTGGTDINANSRLRTAVANARRSGMPKDKIERAIKSCEGGAGGDNYEEVIYEGYGPGGSAFIVKALTDNRNRTVSNLRESFKRSGGSLGITGSVLYLFNKVGMIEYREDVAPIVEIEEIAIEHEAIDVDLEEDYYIITCQIEGFVGMQDALSVKYGDPESAELIFKAEDKIDVNEAKKESIIKLIDMLEDDDDVQSAYYNANI